MCNGLTRADCPICNADPFIKHNAEQLMFGDIITLDDIIENDARTIARMHLRERFQQPTPPKKRGGKGGGKSSGERFKSGESSIDTRKEKGVLETL
jgi:hypothetical protein